MNEGLRNLTVLLWALCAVNNTSYASDKNMVIAEENVQAEPTIIYAASKKSANDDDSVLVEQGANAENPFGNPIVNNNVPMAPLAQPVAVSPNPSPSPSSSSNLKLNMQDYGGQGEPVVPENVNNLGKQFQNTIEEANGMVYDVQAYPVKDLDAAANSSNPKTIYSPNVNP